MTSEFCADNVLVQLASPQVFTDPTSSTSSPNASRVHTSVSAAVELGRRLLLAARAGQTATVLELMAKGAPFTTDWLGTSPLHLAAANNHVETCAVLLRAGVSRDARTKVERTPLHMAAHAGNVAVISLLINHGASIDCRDMLQMTPLHWAAARGHLAAARALVRAGAARGLRCKFRKTPRDLALRNHHHDVLELLDSVPEEIIEKPSEEETPGDFAVLQKMSSPKIIKNSEPNTTRKEKAIAMDIKAEPAQEPKAATSENSDAAQLLKRHGITLLPADPGGTLLTALQSGRTVVLSDAGKLMLKDATPRSPLPAATTPRHTRALKVMPIHNKLVVNERSPKQYQHVKLVQLTDGKLSSGKLVSAKKPVKIVLNKEHLQKLVTVSKPSVMTNPTKIIVKTETEDANILNIQEQIQDKCSNCAVLRAELNDARAQIDALRSQLQALQE